MSGYHVSTELPQIITDITEQKASDEDLVWHHHGFPEATDFPRLFGKHC